MPRGKGYGRGRGRGRKRRYTQRRNGYRGGYNTNFTYGQVVDKLSGDVSKLMGLVNTEFKSHNIINNILAGTTMNVTLLNGLTKGDDLANRDGRMIRAKSIWIRQCFTISPLATSTFVRIIVIIDKQPNETLLTIQEILHSSSIESPKNLDSRKRLIFLYDRVFVLTQNSGTAIYDSFYKDIDMKTVYNDNNTGTITDIETNALYLATFSNEGANQATVGRFTRLRFIDN